MRRTAPLILATTGLLAASLAVGTAGAEEPNQAALQESPASPQVLVVAEQRKKKKSKKVKKVKVIGKLKNAGRNAEVLAIAKDGTSISGAVKGSGKFGLKTKSKAQTKQVFPSGKKAVGPSLHVVRNGKYVGPVLLRKKGKKKGFIQLSASGTKKIKVKTFKLKNGYATGKAPWKVVNKKKKTKLRNGVPLGAGSQGGTGRLASSGSVGAQVAASGVTLNNKNGSLGDDADRDGVPNLADIDMNGDQVLDAAQAESALNKVGGGKLGGDKVLANRPEQQMTFAKILNMSSSTSINSNKTPGLTWNELTSYLENDLQIEALVTGSQAGEALCDPGEGRDCAAARSLKSVYMDCGHLAYCRPGTNAVLAMPPGHAWDGLPLTKIQVSGKPGVLKLPQDSHGQGSKPYETGLLVDFYPRVSGSANQLAGDSFEFVFNGPGGTELARQAKVLTSSVATPPEFKSVDGNAIATVPQSGSPITLNDESDVPFVFYRPQRLAFDASGGTPPLQDRGGLSYNVYIIADDNTFWLCKQDQITPGSADLVKVVEGESTAIYDTNVAPTNGRTLQFNLDVNGCLNDPEAPAADPPTPGDTLKIEMETQDSDGNRTRSRAYIVAPGELGGCAQGAGDDIEAAC